MLKLSKCFSHCTSRAKQGVSPSVSVGRVMWTYKSDKNSTSRENWKEASKPTDVSFNGEETFNVNKTCWQ